ncbi:MAG: chorismate lyase [Idiomarina sp.]|nr:chorismate lyase [Idiomarina sp.]
MSLSTVFPVGCDAQWQAPKLSTPTILAEWLLDSGSLTQKLKDRGAEFKVMLLGQSQGQAETHESDFLGLAPDAPVTVREVLLQLNGVAWVYARSILPDAALSPEDRALTRLGTNPLGETLFSRADIQPGPIQTAVFAANSGPGKLNQQLHQRAHPLHGRRRRFELQQGAILVAEVFLSPCPCYA